jgi:hypothetical protein
MITPTSIFYEKEFYGDILHPKKLVIFIPRRFYEIKENSYGERTKSSNGGGGDLLQGEQPCLMKLKRNKLKTYEIKLGILSIRLLQKV